MSKLLHIRTAEQCLEEASRQPAPKMLFDELWFENELCIFFADTNVGKSILAVQIADAIARGQPMEGFRLEGPPRPVLYLDFELSDKQFEKRYSEEYQNHYPFSQNLMRAGFSPGLSQLKIRSSALFSEVEEHLLKTGCRIVIVDNLSYLSEDALENAQEANALMKELKVLKERLGLSILLLAHTPKRLRHKPLGKGDLAGSSGLSRFADALFALGASTTEKNRRYLKQLKVRSAEFQYGASNVIELEIKKDTNFLGLHFLGYGEERHQLKVEDYSELEGAILELRRDKPKYTQAEIARELGCDAMRVSRTLKKYGKNK